jgi:hypothetical protein
MGGRRSECFCHHFSAYSFASFAPWRENLPIVPLPLSPPIARCPRKPMAERRIPTPALLRSYCRPTRLLLDSYSRPALQNPKKTGDFHEYRIAKDFLPAARLPAQGKER